MIAAHRIGRPAAMLLCAALAFSAGCSAFSTTPPGEQAPRPERAPPVVDAQVIPVGGEVPAWDDPLRPGDVVRLRVWREPELTGDFTVNENGDAMLPRLGAVRVAGQAPDSLKQRIITGYARYLQNPTVEIVLLRRVQILGAVRTPGLYPVDPTMTVSDALALAGGTTPDGSPDRVVLVRNGVRLPVRLESNAPLAGSFIRSGDQIYVDQRSWISRNTGVLTAAITGAVSLLIAFGAN